MEWELNDDFDWEDEDLDWEPDGPGEEAELDPFSRRALRIARRETPDTLERTLRKRF